MPYSTAPFRRILAVLQAKILSHIGNHICNTCIAHLASGSVLGQVFLPATRHREWLFGLCRIFGLRSSLIQASQRLRTLSLDFFTELESRLCAIKSSDGQNPYYALSIYTCSLRVQCIWSCVSVSLVFFHIFFPEISPLSLLPIHASLIMVLC